jgi:hypothetical protein
MNKIVRQHYPVSRLPEDLRGGLAADAFVTVVISTGGAAQPSFRSLFEALEPSRVSSDEAVARVRALRDEWEERQSALEKIRTEAGTDR